MLIAGEYRMLVTMGVSNSRKMWKVIVGSGRQMLTTGVSSGRLPWTISVSNGTGSSREMLIIGDGNGGHLWLCVHI